MPLSSKACYAAGAMMIVAAVCVIASVFVEWWAGGSAGDLANTTPDVATDAYISLWDVDLTLRITDESGNTRMESLVNDWDSHCHTHELTTTWMEGTCMQLKLIRFFIIFGFIVSLAACAILVKSAMSEPLGAFVGAIVSFVAWFCLMAGIALAADLNTSVTFGVYFAFGGVFFASLGVLTALYGTAKAVKESNLAAEEARRVKTETRQERFIAARAALVASRAKLDENISKRIDEEAPGNDEAEVQVPVFLKEVLFWNSRPDADDGPELIPTELLEKAFREIDEDRSGCIELDEFVEALHLCGLDANAGAMEAIMMDIDKNGSGDVDIHEFVDFFRSIEDLNKFEQKKATRAQIVAFLLNCCFLCDIVAVGILLMLFIRLDENASEDDQVILKNTLLACAIILGVLFCCVVGMPAARLTLGPTLSAIEARLQAMKRKPRAPVEEEKPAKMAWQPEVAPKAPELAASSYRTGRVQNTVAASNQILEDQVRAAEARASKKKRSSMATVMSQPPASAASGLMRDGGVDRYDPDQYMQTEVMLLRMRNTCKHCGTRRAAEDELRTDDWICPTCYETVGGRRALSSFSPLQVSSDLHTTEMIRSMPGQQQELLALGN